MDLAAGLRDQPEAVTADPGHVRIDHRQRRRRRHARLNRGAAIGQHVTARLRCEVMRRGHNAAQRSGGMEHQPAPGALTPVSPASSSCSARANNRPSRPGAATSWMPSGN